MANAQSVVLVTGCSSGIGQATAVRLARAGMTVYATARRVADLAPCTAAGCVPLALDVTDEASMSAAVAQIEAANGAIDILINNAGFSQSGAVEAVSIERVRAQFETNVVGLLRLTQLVVPAMRQRARGRIINLSSMGGTLVFPGGGVYHASKYAIEALSDALRFELRGFGIDVVAIQPGLIRSQFSEAAVSGMRVRDEIADVYRAFHERVAALTKEAYETGPLASLAGSADDVARTIERAATTAKPRARYRVTGSATLLMTLRRLLGDAGWDRFLRSSYPTPTRSPQ